MNDDLSKLIDEMSHEEKILVLSYFSANREKFLFAAREAKLRYERADGYRSDQTGALRYAEALAATCKRHWIEGGCVACDRRLAAVLAVRDEEMEQLRQQAEATVVSLTEVVQALVDADDCQYDHHGGCQTHGQGSDPYCAHARAKELLAALDSPETPR